MKTAFSLLAFLLAWLPASTGLAAGGEGENIARASFPSPQAYRKKVAAVRFHVVNPQQVEDIADIWNAYPLELLRRLEGLGGVLPISSISSLPQPDGREPNPDSPASREIIRHIAEQLGGQFVISGVILDAGANNDGIRRAEYAWPWPNFRHAPSERRLESEIFLHDGLTGALILRRRDHVLASGNVMVGRNRPFASEAFIATPFGRAVAEILDTQAAAISQELARQPFSATMVRIEGRKIYLNAGGMSALAPGSRLVVYRRHPATPVSTLTAQNLKDVPESSAAVLTLFQVQPFFSIGELAADPARLNLQVGDVARVEAPILQTPDPARP